MASDKRDQTSLLESKLVRSSRKFTFEKAVDLINGRGGKYAQVDRNYSVENETILFRANPSLGFPSSDIDQIIAKDNGKLEMVVNFLGLYGPSSPLPTYFTESIIEENRDVEQENLDSFYIVNEAQLYSLINQLADDTRNAGQNQAIKKKLESGTIQSKVLTDEQLQIMRNSNDLSKVISAADLRALKNEKLVFKVYSVPKSNQRDFLDLFNHRLITLYYLSQKKYRPESSPDIKKRQQHRDMLYSLIGAPTEEMRNNSSLNWLKLLKYTGLLAMKNGNPEIICKVIAGYFSLPLQNISISEGIERSVRIPEFQRWRLGMDNTQLNKTAIIGDNVPDHQGKFRVNINDLDVRKFVRFLPFPKEQRADKQGDLHDPLVELCEFLRAPEQTFDVCLKLNEHESVPFTLEENSVNRLGWSCWLSTCRSDNNWAIIN